MGITDRLKEYRIVQNGQVVAGVAGAEKRAWREILHYAALYSEEGPLAIQTLARGRWRRVLIVNETDDLASRREALSALIAEDADYI